MRQGRARTFGLHLFCPTPVTCGDCSVGCGQGVGIINRLAELAKKGVNARVNFKLARQLLSR